MKYNDFEAVINLIKEGGFGSYLLYSNVGGELLGGSHITSEDNKDVLQLTTDKLIEDLRYKVDLLGWGSYKVLLKKNNKTQNANAVVYRFEIRPDGQGGSPQAQAMAGFGNLEGVTSQIEARVAEKVEAIRQKMEQEAQIKELSRQIEELKNGGTGAQSQGMQGLIDVAKMGFGLIVAKTAPEAIPAIKAMLGTIENAEASATKPDPFVRTD